MMMSVRVEAARLGAVALQRAGSACQPARRFFATQDASAAAAQASLASRVRGIQGKDVRRAIPVVSLVAAVTVWIQNGQERAALEKMRAHLEKKS